ncbi:MAG TPA: T6SS immunity protein Tdi1 domain-containing protein, partial [Planctomycetaceae bacterium]|nr:T6SS immunity protein Tdi1 domain-containing protein [Planctomycetaceae bacterium]
NPDNNSNWFGVVLVDQLRAAGKVLGPNECYCYSLLPILGGEYAPDNFCIHDVVHHFQIWGPIHEQLRDVPDGTTIVFKVE